MASSSSKSLWEAAISKPRVTAIVLTGTAASLYVACKAWQASDKEGHRAVTELVGLSLAGSEEEEAIEKPQKRFKVLLADNEATPFVHMGKEREAFEDSDPHPYGPEIRALIASSPPPPPLPPDNNIPPPMTNTCTWVETPAQLAELATKLCRETEFGVDTEQHSRRSFLGFTSLLQISTRTEDFLVDAIALHDHMHLLAAPFADGAITKVLHGADSDCLWLQRDFHIYIVNLFDTARACDVLGKPQRSLAYLLRHYCGVTTQKQYQVADWRQRPLPEAMVEYARKDAHYLLFIADRLRKELLSSSPHVTLRSSHVTPDSHATLESTHVGDVATTTGGGKPAAEGEGLSSEVYRQAVARSNALSLQLYEKDLSNPVAVATSVLSRYYSAPNPSIRHRPQQAPGTDSVFRALVRSLCVWRDATARAEDESLRFVLSDAAVIAIALLQPTDSPSLVSAVESVSDNDTALPGGGGASPVLRAHAPHLCHLIRRIAADGGRSAAAYCGTSPRPKADESAAHGLAKLTGMWSLFWSSAWSPFSSPAQRAELAIRGDSGAPGAEHDEPRSLPSAKKSGGGGGKAKDAEQWRERFVAKFSCKAPVYHNCRIYAGDGRLLCFCDKKKIQWYIQRGLAEYTGEDPPSIRLLFEPKGRPEDENNEFYIQGKTNRCVCCGETEHYLRYRIIPSCYRQHFPEHLKSHRSHDIVLLCVDCHELAHKAAEAHKRHVALRFGVPLSPSRLISPSRRTSSPAPEDNGVDPANLRRSATAILRHGTGMPPERLTELMNIMRKFYGKDEVSREEIEAARVAGMGPRGQRKAASRGLITTSETDVKEPLLEAKLGEEEEGEEGREEDREAGELDPESSEVRREDVVSAGEKGKGAGERGGKLCSGEGMLGHAQHGKRVVEMILEGGGEEGVRDFIQQWREVFVVALQPKYLPTRWDVRHSGVREFGDFSVYNPQRKASTSAPDGNDG